MHHPYYSLSFPCIKIITGKSTFGFLPYALIVTDPSATTPGTNAPLINDSACVSVADGAKLISTLLFDSIFEFEILHVYGDDEPDQLALSIVAFMV